MFIALLLAASAPETIGAWKISEGVDAMTDKREPEGKVYSAEGNALLSFNCSDAGRGNAPVRFMVTTDEFLGDSSTYQGRGRREIMFRIESEPAEKLWWYYGDHSAFTLDMPAVSEFGNILRRGTKLLVRAITYRGHQIDATFDVTGASEMIDRVKFLCRKNDQK
ncbi:hypothetical protein [Sphingobium sp. CFD-1]|uniref:hypothetical protein n=1 Tax=Sphingobium sp. CFD-1 TaxID=2878545 RepID=UPI00214C3F7F|nr:hypothetical protein [Sphingobium sp. CFD-1]